MATGPRHYDFREDQAEANISIWKEALFAADILLLHSSPVYYGLGVPHGDGSAVILVPGFLGTDAYLTQLHTWLGRIGYRPYFSGIGINAECPNILIQQRLNACIEKALLETKRKIHLIGHSLGGIIARSVAGQRPSDVASVITLASPFRGTVAHRTVLQAAEAVRKHILKEHGSRSAANLLHQPLHLQLPRFDPSQRSRVSAGDCHLHPQRRHRGLALLSDRKS